MAWFHSLFSLSSDHWHRPQYLRPWAFRGHGCPADNTNTISIQGNWPSCVFSQWNAWNECLSIEITMAHISRKRQVRKTLFTHQSEMFLTIYCKFQVCLYCVPLYIWHLFYSKWIATYMVNYLHVKGGTDWIYRNLWCVTESVWKLKDILHFITLKTQYQAHCSAISLFYAMGNVADCTMHWSISSA